MKKRSIALLMAAMMALYSAQLDVDPRMRQQTQPQLSRQQRRPPRHLMMQQQLTLHLMQMASMLEKR
ncbi:MAG: hypothetical protein V8S38_07930 [Lachnospiraceae bacterium]